MSQTPLPRPEATVPSLGKQLLMLGSALIGIVMVAGLITVFQLVQAPQDLTKQAAPATSLSLTTLANPVIINQVFSVPISATTGSNLVRALDVALQYDPATLQLLDVTKGPWLTQATVVTKRIDQMTGRALISLVIFPTAQPGYVSGTGTAAFATFKAIKASSSTAISFDRVNSIAGGANEPQNVVNNYVDVSLTVLPDTQPPTVDNFIVYSYEPCINQNADGRALSTLWKSSIYPGAKTVEVSTVSSFATYATKAATNAKLTANGWSIVDGAGFKTTNAGGANADQTFVFNPDVTYYFRLKYEADQYSGVLAYKPTACSNTTLRQCNDNCNSSSECSANLVCSNNKCRRDGNTGNDQCVLPPDNGIRRACNEYCSDSKECGSDLTCWYNQCRNPKDVTLANCKLPLAAGEVESCNRYCADSSECSGGLTCWYNQCRLAQNLKNDKCQVVQPTKVSTSSAATTTRTTAKPTSKPTATPTGKTIAVNKVVIDPQPTATPTLPIKPTTTPRPTSRPTATPAAAVTPPRNTPGSLNWVPAVLGLIVVAVIGLIAWPKIQSMLKPPKAKVVPPTPTPTSPPAALRPTEPQKRA